MTDIAATAPAGRLPAARERSLALLGSPWLWATAGIAFTLLLRAPFLDAALGRDEGGDTMIALAWHHSGPFPYGSYFLDRPPLLMVLYRVAATLGGATGVRVLGSLAAVAAVALATRLAVRLGGRRAAPFAAAASAVMVSSVAAMAVYTPAELLAIVPSTASLLLLVDGLQRPAGGRALFAAAGAAAAAALLVKQSFGDALVAGAVGLAVATVAARGARREWALRACFYAAGFAAVLLAMLAWAAFAGVSLHGLWYAIVGFRIDSAHTFANAQAEGRIANLKYPTVHSGLAVALACAVVGIVMLRARTGVRPALAAWLLAGAAGAVLGGSFWPHYVIELMPVAAVGAALLLSRRPAIGALALCILVLPAAAGTLRPGLADSPDGDQHAAVTLGRYVHLRAEPGQTAYVLYARVNALYYSGLPSPYPYHWSLMMKAVPGAKARLRALLASAQRPTWIIQQDRTNGYGLDPRGLTRRAVAEHYRPLARICGKRILLARGAPARPAPPMLGSCQLTMAAR